MTSYLRLNHMGHAPVLSIDDDMFEELAGSRRALTAAFGLEEAYELLIGNYVEVERELLVAAASDAVRTRSEYQDFFELRSTVNRRVVNLLTSTRLYLDQAPQRLFDCAADAEFARHEFTRRTRYHYDDCFSYRFMEALRNYVQHCGLAVHRINHSHKWGGEPEDPFVEITVKPFAERHYLAADERFKSKVLKEMPTEVLLTRAIREYLQCIGDVHMWVREHIADRVVKARDLMSSQISRYASENNGSTTGLSAFRCNSSGEKESLPLLLDWDDIRVKLVAKNSGLSSLSRHVVTGKA